MALDLPLRRDRLRRDANVAKELRATLAEHYTLERPEIVTQQVSTDGTRKWLIRLGPGIEAESGVHPRRRQGRRAVRQLARSAAR
jgi:adenine C2-methylase RlmN of 23S rRNA A2503 and tRNA A37